MTNEQIRDLAQIEWDKYLASVLHIPISKRMNWVTWIRGVEWLYECHMRKLHEVNEVYHKALMKLLGMLLPYNSDGKMNPQVTVVNEALDAAAEILKSEN